jgi:hypothetical protein
VATEQTLAQRIAETVIAVLCGRGGFDHWWDDIDDETQADILAELAQEINDLLDEKQQP